MPRLLDLECSGCGAEVDDFFVMRPPCRLIHLECGGELEPVYRLRPRAAQWSDRDSITVFRKPDGTFSYPMRNDVKTPPNCERVSIRSLPELRAFERQAGVTSHIANYDSTGRSIDDETPSPQHRESEDQRYNRFRESTRGIF